MDPLLPTIVGIVSDQLLSKVGDKAVNELGRRFAEEGEERRRRAVESLCAGVAIELDLVGEPVTADEVLDRFANGDLEVLDWHFRSMLGGVVPAAYPYVVKLTAEYVGHRRPRDAFFQRVGGLLQAAEQQEILALVELLSDVGATLRRPGLTSIKIYDRKSVLTVQYRQGPEPQIEGSTAVYQSANTPKKPEAVRPGVVLLCAHRLNGTPRHAFPVWWETPEEIEMTRRLVRLFVAR